MYFNPLPRKEGDGDLSDLGGKIDISIHSLVKRETTKINFVNQFTKDFNPLPRKEGDNGKKELNLI